MLLPPDPLMDVALDPVVDVPVEPTTGALGAGAAGALPGAVLPVEVLGGLPGPNGAILGTAVGRAGRFGEYVVFAVAYTGVEGAFALDVNRQRPMVWESPLCRAHIGFRR
jgi:hypothetical protein